MCQRKKSIMQYYYRRLLDAREQEARDRRHRHQNSDKSSSLHNHQKKGAIHQCITTSDRFNDRKVRSDC